jgi:hypothetical protein
MHEYTRTWCEEKVEEMETNIFVLGSVVALDKYQYTKKVQMAKDTAQWWICIMTDIDSSRSFLDRMNDHQLLREDLRHVVGYCP